MDEVRIRWVLYTPVSDVNWQLNADRLTDEELLYCLRYARGSTRIKKLEALARKRGIIVDSDSSKDS